MSHAFTRQTLVRGQWTAARYIEVEKQVFRLSSGALTVARLEDEWYEDLLDPQSVITALKHCGVRADILTFWQRLPYSEPRFPFYYDWDTIAALPILGFQNWWDKQIKPATRNLVRKATKKGVEVREAVYDDDFVRGMTDIFNETPVRQGRRFWHYGKDFQTVKTQFARFLHRETLLGAYHNGELIGFVMLGDAGTFGEVGQIISKLSHRDKSPNNALIAKAVQVCEKRGLPYLVYAYWHDGGLTDFKRHNGFEPRALPRYYVPLTRRGTVALSLGAHAGWKALLPGALTMQLKRIRSRWLNRQIGGA